MSRHRHMHHTKEGLGLVLTIPTPTHSAVFSGGLRPCQQLLHCDPRTPGLTCENVVYTQLHLLFHKGSCAWILLDQSRPHDAPLSQDTGGWQYADQLTLKSQNLLILGWSQHPHQSPGLWEGAIIILNSVTFVRRHKSQLFTSGHSPLLFLSQTLTL